MAGGPAIVLFGQDLRLRDNPALSAAVESSRPLIFLYVLDDVTPGRWKMGAAQRWWLHHSLRSLEGSLAAHNQRLVLRRGALQEVLTSLIAETQATHLYYNRRYEPWFSIQAPVETHSFNGSLLIEPWDLTTKSGAPFRVFTPFWKRALELIEPSAPLPAPPLCDRPAAPDVASDQLDSWQLRPRHPNWAAEFSTVWKPGEEGGWKRLEQFVEGPLELYQQQRDFPAVDGVSCLSPHLHLGEISPHQIWHALRNRRGEGARVYCSELGWREFSYYLLHHFPTIDAQNFNPKFDALPWQRRPEALELWQQGMTGYPIVDAGMRQLWHTGWMHNRVRMIVASFLTKDLFIDWREGASWFWDTLVDADLASNSASWQWVAGSGADAAPYFRIFNPTLQAERFDPEGDYVRRWVPEIAHLPPQVIHQPWRVGGHNYPAPLVDHAVARKEALALFADLTPPAGPKIP